MALITLAYSQFDIFVKQHYTTLNFWLFGGSVGLHYLGFNVSHFFLADKYYRMVKRAPNVLDGKPCTNDRTLFEQFIYWTMLLFNVLSAIVYGFTTSLFYEKVWSKGENPELVKTWIIVSNFTVRACLIVSGAILVACVVKIRAYFKAKNATDYIDTKMLLRHGIAYGLYLVGSITTALVLMVYNLRPDNKALIAIIPWVLIGNSIC